MTGVQFTANDVALALVVVCLALIGCTCAWFAGRRSGQ